MKKSIRKATCLVWLLALLPFLSGCNNEDDVLEIFVGKTWKLSFIAAEGSTKQYDLWNGNEAAREKSMLALGTPGTFTLSFEGTDLNGRIGGAFNGRGITSNVDGRWNADGKSRELNIEVKSNSKESDPLARAFLDGLKYAFRYEGDSQFLYIYYKEGQTVKFMAFTIPKN